MKCRKHPRYAAMRRPTSQCAPCHQIWQSKQKVPIIEFVCQPKTGTKMTREIPSALLHLAILNKVKRLLIVFEP
jgi:hypothetical protein